MDDAEREMRASRGLGVLLANIGGGNIGNGSQKPQPQRGDYTKPPPMGNDGFNLNSVGEFSGWGDLSSGSNWEVDSYLGNNQRTDNRRGRGFGFTASHKKYKPKEGDNQPSGDGCESSMAHSNFNQRRAGGNVSRGYHSPYSNNNKNQRWNSSNRDMGYKRDPPQGGQNEYHKRQRLDQEEVSYGTKEMTSWTDILEYDDDHDTEWFNEENKRLAEEYGCFVTVKYIESQPGKVGYYCELCYAEMNARKSLELHCGGMKHLKKKNLWEKNKGAAAKKESFLNDNQYATRYSEGSDSNHFNHFGQSSEPYNGASSQKPTVSQENLAGGPTGTLIKRLAECSVKHQDDAQLASDVITMLLKSLKDYHQRRGYDEVAHLLDESEVKFNIIKALQNNPQLRKTNPDKGPQEENYSSQYYYPPGAPPNYQQGSGQMQYNAPPYNSK